jgi:hypothetical protein
MSLARCRVAGRRGTVGRLVILSGGKRDTHGQTIRGIICDEHVSGIFLEKQDAIWPAPDLDDTQLGESSLSLELHRAQIPDRRVPSL